jgi:murein DD-endopeptidase MepM/ murein hydrolase activator NlpD
VDLEQPRGTPVRAVHEAVVQRLVRDEAAGGGSGRSVSLLHKEGQLQTTYLHLHTIRADLRAGSKVAGGELIGTVGSTGNALGPHLHFGLSMRQGETFRFIDPEPLIRHWSL